jgi:hypothetical protein
VGCAGESLQTLGLVFFEGRALSEEGCEILNCRVEMVSDSSLGNSIVVGMGRTNPRGCNALLESCQERRDADLLEDIN